MSTTELHYAFPHGDPGDLPTRIRAVVASDVQLLLALTKNLKRYDRLAIFIDGTFAITDVMVKEGGELRVHCRFEWEAYYGCNDLRRHDVEKESIPGHYENGELVLRIWFPEPRSTADEL
jgi:hypothetical protein